jgi:lipopolysaccharide export system protein LptA
VPDLGGSLERMVVAGDVRITQPGRTGIGEQLTYTAATDTVALTGAPGKPPRVTAEQGSVVTGATLLFRSTDSTIVVAGTEGGPKAPGGTRVHTETDLKAR